VPRVSVLIPSFNGASYIQAAIDSVLSQGIGGLELIVADDNSSDGTADIVASYRDSRIRLERNAANLGAQGNWNRVLTLATGDYIKLMPQDDLLRPGCLPRQIAVLDADTTEEIALVFGARDIIGANGRVIARRGLGRRTSGRVTARGLVRQCVRRGTNMIGEPGAVLFRRSFADKVGLFDASQPYVIDLDYWLRLLAHGDAWYLAEPVSAFRISRTSWSVAIGRNQGGQYASFLDRMQCARLIQVSAFDIMLGKFVAQINNILRLMFYRLVIR
jgi:glycosyltransferase involved in cell wall biosynthesis